MITAISKIAPAYCSATAGLLLVFILTFFSCSGNQEVHVNSQGRGRALIELKLHPIAIGYMRDIAEGFSGRPLDDDFAVFDLSEIVKRFAEIPAVTLEKLETPSPRHLVLEFAFTDLNNIFRPVPGAPRVMEFISHRGGSELVVHITRQNFSSIVRLTAMEDSEALAIFGPQKEDPYTEAEYIEMVEFAMGEYEKDEPLASILKNAALTAVIHVDGPLTEAKDAEYSGSTAVATIPLLDLVTLADPVKISLRWE